MSGSMTDNSVMRVLEGLHCASVEVFFHPSLPPRDPLDPYGPNTGDLQALLSPNLRRFLTGPDWELTNYAGLRRRSREKTGDRH